MWICVSTRCPHVDRYVILLTGIVSPWLTSKLHTDRISTMRGVSGVPVGGEGRGTMLTQPAGQSTGARRRRTKERIGLVCPRDLQMRQVT